MRKFVATRKPVDGDVPPEDFLNTLIDKINALPDSYFEVNSNSDIYSTMKPVAGQYTSILNRRAWMAEGLRASASTESDYNWLEGRDLSASNTSPQTTESGIFQCSLNSIYTAGIYDEAIATKLKKLFTAHTGLAYSQSNAAGKAFIAQMKSDHEFAIEFMIVLMRATVRTHGPILRKEINNLLSKEAVKEFESFMSAGTVEEEQPLPVGLPPRPRSYDDMYRIFGNPRETNWSNKNLAFCPVNIPCFPLVSAHGARGFYCHKLLVPAFKKVFDTIIAQGLTKLVYDFSGCYNLRNISGSSNLSLHSWATAIDINYDGNELGDTTPAMDKRIVKIFTDVGFFWGGNYRGRKDPMHFEWYDRS